jgi:hypothetical protein
VIVATQYTTTYWLDFKIQINPPLLFKEGCPKGGVVKTPLLFKEGCPKGGVVKTPLLFKGGVPEGRGGYEIKSQVFFCKNQD